MCSVPVSFMYLLVMFHALDNGLVSRVSNNFCFVERYLVTLSRNFCERFNRELSPSSISYNLINFSKWPSIINKDNCSTY